VCKVIAAAEANHRIRIVGVAEAEAEQHSDSHDPAAVRCSLICWCISVYRVISGQESGVVHSNSALTIEA
jgi:hypothetical protein